MKIKIHDSTYIFLFISFLSGYFECIYLLLLIIFIHEMGHFIFGLFCGINVSNIIIYPFGGITCFNCDLNIRIYKEFICLIGGIVFQISSFFIIRYLFLKGFVSLHVFSLIKDINFLLISFNFLPIIPLDGGKLFNLFCDRVFCYKKSFKISFIISIIFSFIFLINSFTFLSFILFIFLINNIMFEYKNFHYKFNKFLLERYVNDYGFKKYRIINNIYFIKRDFCHIICNKFEKSFLRNLFENI